MPSKISLADDRRRRMGLAARRLAFSSIAVLPALILALGAPAVAFAQAAGGTPPAPASAPTNASNPSPSDQTDEERQKLFQQFFGKTKKPQGDKHIDVPIILDAQPIGLVPAILPEDITAARLSAKGLQDALNTVLVDSVLTKIDQAKSEDGYVPLGALRDAGLGAKMDALTLALSLDVPGDLRKPQLLDLKGHGSPPVTGSGTEIKPAQLSSYLNMHGDLDYVHDGSTPGLQPLNLALDGALNFDGQVLQSTGTYVESGQRRWQRGDTRLVHDDPDNANRYQLGDLLYPLTGFQTSQPLGGISLARDYTLQPYTSIQPAGQQQFILTSPSKVEVDVNGHPTEVIRLPPGRYDIRNFPFAQGANDVQLQVTDASGRTSTTNIPFFFDSNLLDVGVSEFDYTLGLPLVSNNGLRKYPLTFPSYSMFHNYGFSNAITAGANLQGNENQVTPGLELGAATPIGNFNFDAAGSRVRGFGLACACFFSRSDRNLNS